MNTQIEAFKENEESGLHRVYEGIILHLAKSWAEGGFTAEEMLEAVKRVRDDPRIEKTTIHSRILKLMKKGFIAETGEKRRGSRGRDLRVYKYHEHEPDVFTEVVSRGCVLRMEGAPFHCVAEMDGERSPVFESIDKAHTWLSEAFERRTWQ